MRNIKGLKLLFNNVRFILYRFKFYAFTKLITECSCFLFGLLSLCPPNSPWKVKVEFNFANGNHLLLSMKMIKKCTFAECFTRKCCRQIIITTKDNFYWFFDTCTTRHEHEVRQIWRKIIFNCSCFIQFYLFWLR